MEGGKISIQFPQYHLTAEIIEDKLVAVRESTTSRDKEIKLWHHNAYSLGQILSKSFQ